jgi:heat shock protein HslJ
MTKEGKLSLNFQLAPTLVLALLFAVLTPLGSTSSAEADSMKPVYGKARWAISKDLQSLTFISTSVRVKGRLFKLASGKPISMRFDDGSVSLTAGCNTLAGKYTMSKGLLRAQSLFSTKMACPEKVMDQDVWLNQMISSKPKLEIQFLTKNSAVTAASTVITLNSNLTPALKSGRTVIRFKIYETYGFADTPLGDENSEALVKEICDKLIADKATESQAQVASEQNGLIFRVTSREGENFPSTLDYRVNRMNVEILGGVVSACVSG